MLVYNVCNNFNLILPNIFNLCVLHLKCVYHNHHKHKDEGTVREATYYQNNKLLICNCA